MGIYKITSPSGNCYIGSSVNIKRRFCQHKSVLRRGKCRNKRFQNAYVKYGQSNFKFEQILCVFDKKDLIEFEQYFIDLYKPKYNLSKVAKCPMLDKDLAKKLSVSIKKSNTHKVARLRNQKLAAKSVSKPVIRLTDNVRFESGYAAAAAVGVKENIDNISTAIKNGWKFGGHYWRFEDSDVTLESLLIKKAENEKNRRLNAREKCVKARSKPVKRLSDGKIFSSAVAAARELGLYRTAVFESIKRGTERLGSRWEYA